MKIIAILLLAASVFFLASAMTEPCAKQIGERTAALQSV